VGHDVSRSVGADACHGDCGLVGGSRLPSICKRTRSVTSKHSPILDKGSVVLSATLREAEIINAYRTDLPGGPRVHLGPIVRITPAKYQDGVNDIPRHLSKGHVVSVDLGLMSASQAARSLISAAVI